MKRLSLALSQGERVELISPVTAIADRPLFAGKRTHGPDESILGYPNVSTPCGMNLTHAALRAAISSRIAFLPSPNIIRVLSAAKRGLGMPAKPGLRLRFTTITVRA